MIRLIRIAPTLGAIAVVGIVILLSVSSVLGASGDELVSAAPSSPVGEAVYPTGEGSSQRADDKNLKSGLHSIGADQFSLDEFCGSYSMSYDPGRVLLVARVPGEADVLLFHDSKTGLTRTLIEYSPTIFTYGPDVGVSEPVEGTVMFLPIKDSSLSKQIGFRSRLLWQPATPPAIVATRVSPGDK